MMHVHEGAERQALGSGTHCPNGPELLAKLSWQNSVAALHLAPLAHAKAPSVASASVAVAPLQARAAKTAPAQSARVSNVEGLSMDAPRTVQGMEHVTTDRDEFRMRGHRVSIAATSRGNSTAPVRYRMATVSQETARSTHFPKSGFWPPSTMPASGRGDPCGFPSGRGPYAKRPRTRTSVTRP